MRTAFTAVILVSTVMLPSMVRAATFVVDSTQDASDAVANGVCATAIATCTLRAAVQEANSTPGADVIQVPPGTYVLTQPGNPFAEENNSAVGDLDVTGDVTIVGAGSAVTIFDGDNLNHSDRLVHVLSGTVEIRGVTIRAGYSLWNGGGILNQGTLTVRQSVVTGNHADGQTATGGGGGIANVGTMTLEDSTVTANTSGESAGGVGNFGTMTVERCIIANNHVPDVLWPYGGGGIGNQGTLVIRDSTVRDNSSGQNAGGIGNLATATVERCTITGNHAAVGASLGGGGGLGNASWVGPATLTVINTTISGNTSAEDGGGIANASPSTPATAIVSLRNVTLAGNTADSDLDGVGDGGGVSNVVSAAGNGFPGVVNVQNSIVGTNGDAGTQAPDCAGTLTSAGFNLIQATAGCVIAGATTGNLTGANPMLGPLAGNGGPTETRALLAGSLAINAGSVATPGSGGSACAASDQRGVGRPLGVPARCDMGAFEVVVCGDGVPSAPAELCDAGAANGSNDCCTVSCTFIDADGDGICNAQDNCPAGANADQRNSDCEGGGDVCDPCPLSSGTCPSDQTEAASIPPTGGTVTTATGAVVTCPTGAKCGTCTDGGTSCTAVKTACAVNGDCPVGTTCGPTSLSIMGANQSTCPTASSFCLGNSGTNLVGGIASFGPAGRVFNPDPANHPEWNLTLEFRWLDLEGGGAGDGLVNSRAAPYPNTTIAEANLKPFRNGKFLGTCSTKPHVICASDLPCPAGAGNCNDNKTCNQFPACPSATSAICCDTASNKFVLRTFTFSEYALGLDACDPMIQSQMNIARIAAPAGDDSLSAKGTFTLAPPLTVDNLDPLTHGLQLVVSDTPGTVIDLVIPPATYDPIARVGWKVNSAGTKWTYVNKSAAPPAGISQIGLTDKSTKSPGLVQYAIRGKRGAYAASVAVMPTIVLPGSQRCFAADFRGVTPGCDLNSSSTSLKCKCACDGKGIACGVCAEGPKRVFVSSTTHTGALGGLAGADAICQGLADGAGLGGTYKGWLSNAATNVASRLTPSSDEYRLVNGTVLASGWNDLVDGTLNAPIDRDEIGTLVPPSHVWTGSTEAGALLGNTCGSWTIGTNTAWGHYGLSDSATSTWSDSFIDVCDVPHRLYCVEQ